MVIFLTKANQKPKREIFHLFGKAVFVFLTRVIGAGSVFLTQILLARWMGAAEVGIYIYAFSWCNLLSIVAGIGLHAAAIRFIGQGLADDRSDLIVGFSRRGTQIVFLVSVAFALAGAGAVTVTNGIISPTYLNALLWAAAAIPFLALISWEGCVAQGLSWFSLAFLPSNIYRPVFFLGAVAGAWYLAQPLNAANVMLYHLAVMASIWVVISLYMKFRLYKQFPKVKPSYQTSLWLRTSYPLLIIMLFSSYFLEINVVSVAMYFQPDQLAIFNACFRVAVLIAFGIQSVDAILLPKAALLFSANDTDGLQRVTALTTQLKFWSAVIALVILWFFGKLILRYFGDSFVVGHQALMILAGAQLVRAALGPVSQLLSITGNHYASLFVSMFATALMFGLNHLLIPQFGLEGAAYTVLAVMSLEALLLSFVVKKRLGINASVFGIFKLIK